MLEEVVHIIGQLVEQLNLERNPAIQFEENFFKNYR